MLKSELHLILELQKNGRLSYEQLSRRLGVSVPTIHRLFKKLLEQDIMRIQALPNPFKFGYDVTYVITLKVRPQKVNEVCLHLSMNRHVNLVQTAMGHFNILAIVFFKNIDDLYAFLQHDITDQQEIEEIELYTVHRMRKRYNHLFPGKALVGPPVKLDENDDRIILELQKDGRQSYKTIAERTGIPTSTISRRVNYLQKYNIIKICALPNPLKLGFPVNAFIKIEAVNSKIDAICTTLDKHKNVNMIGIALGQYNIMLVVHFPDIWALSAFVMDELPGLEGIKNIDTIVLTGIKKRFYGWILSEQMVSESTL